MADIIEKYFPELSEKQKEQFNSLQSLYEDWNEKINVISRKDIENFYERHVLHSLAIAKLISFKPGTTVLDFGTGGGVPGIPLAIFFPEVKFHLVDSIGKKISVVKNIAASLQLKNVSTQQIRVEELNQKYDFITCRAVAEIPQLLKWTKKLLSRESKNEIQNGWLFLKGGDLSAELENISRQYKLIAVSSFFQEEFFREKWLIYLK